MIQSTISDLNASLTLLLGTTSAQVLGTAKAVNDQSQKGAALMTDGETPARLTIDDRYDWQSAHILGRLVLNPNASSTFGTISENHYDLIVTLIVATKRTDLLDFLMNAFSMVEYIAIEEINTDTLDVLRRNWLLVIDQTKNYDPALRAAAVRYRIPDVKCVTGSIVHEQVL